MPVDRIRRDAAADALASLLRGEMRRDALVAALQQLRQPDEPEGKPKPERDAYLDAVLNLWSPDERYISEDMWGIWCRHVAFLKTDLERASSHEREDESWQIPLARWHTLGLLIALGVAYLTRWWIFVAADLLSFLLYMASAQKRGSLANEERSRRLEYYPFTDKDEWLAHKHLVDEYNLPACHAGAFDDPPSVKTWPPFIASLVRWALYSFVAVFVAAMVLYMYAFSIIMWPLWLVMMSLCRREASCQQQVTS